MTYTVGPPRLLSWLELTTAMVHGCYNHRVRWDYTPTYNVWGPHCVGSLGMFKMVFGAAIFTAIDPGSADRLGMIQLLCLNSGLIDLVFSSLGDGSVFR